MRGYQFPIYKIQENLGSPASSSLPPMKMDEGEDEEEPDEDDEDFDEDWEEEEEE